jgi:hypothetical protein
MMHTFGSRGSPYFTAPGTGCGLSESPKGGAINIGDRNVFDGAKDFEMPAEQRNLGLVFQSYALWPHKTVFENVAYGFKLPARVAQRNGRQVQLDINGTRLQASARGAGASGEGVTIIRVEEVRISATPADNAIELPLLTCMYLGDRFACLFKGEAGTEISLRAYSKYRLEPGRYWLQLPAEKLWVFCPDSANLGKAAPRLCGPFFFANFSKMVSFGENCNHNAHSFRGETIK